MGAELFHADRRTETQTDRHDKANSSFSQFCEYACKAIIIFELKEEFPDSYISRVTVK